MYHIYVAIKFLQAAIISLGLIGAGTNNARIAGMLRNLSSYYYKEAAHLFCVSIYQRRYFGILHVLIMVPWFRYKFHPLIRFIVFVVRLELPRALSTSERAC
jgi:hypothetical protein